MTYSCLHVACFIHVLTSHHKKDNFNFMCIGKVLIFHLILNNKGHSSFISLNMLYFGIVTTLFKMVQTGYCTRFVSCTPVPLPVLSAVLALKLYIFCHYTKHAFICQVIFEYEQKKSHACYNMGYQLYY